MPRCLSFLIFLIIIFGTANAFAQQSGSGNNYLSITANKALTFDISNTTDFDNPKTISGALTISLRSKDFNCKVNVRAVISSNTTTPIPESMLSLQYTGTTSTDGTPVTTAIQLATFDKLLFTQPRTNPGTTLYYNYDLKMAALNYSYDPGDYTINFTFTMTQTLP